MVEEHALELIGGRTLAYAQSGNTSSAIVLLFFHGAFGVGDASHPSPVLIAKNIHFLTPTLPGWGRTSPLPSFKPYHVGLAEDITALLDHLYPDDSRLELYVAGGSFGTVPAQMLYGAPFDVFPAGRRLKGCLLIAPFSPFRYHTEYTKSMTLPSYISIGPPAQYVPFRLLQRAARLAIASQLKDQAGVERLIRKKLTGSMGKEERELFRRWREGKGRKEEEVIREMGENVMKSIEKSWAGFMELSDVVHSDWGFRPDELDDEHRARAVLIVSSSDDVIAPEAMARWLLSRYDNCSMKSIKGGHIGSLFHLDGIYDDFLSKHIG